MDDYGGQPHPGEKLLRRGKLKRKRRRFSLVVKK